MQTIASTPRWRIGVGGEWFEPPSGGRVDLRKKPTLARVLRALVDTAEREPGAILSVAELVQLGWPDEHLLKRAAKNRLYVAISTLRKLGLAGALEREAEGYRLAASIVLVRSR